MRVWRGSPYPLGATWDGTGVNVAVFSEHATAVELCLFDADGGNERRVHLPDRTEFVWHGAFPDLRPGQRYGLRVDGPFEPEAGHRFNPRKLLLDPYARWIDGTIRVTDRLFGFPLGDPQSDLAFDERDSAADLPKCVVVDPAFDWGADAAPRIPFERTLIYEVHVKGFTVRHPDVPPELRGTYLGLASPPALEHLQRLGVTAVELMPVHHHVTNRFLAERGLTNYWGYNSAGFFAPDTRFATPGGDPVREFREMVRGLHAAGIEVILDVVYNHTGEGDELGPTLSFRGIDNASYYRLREGDARRYLDYTGTGNTLNGVHPRVLQLIMDSLRYWVGEMHVDGFRFDLASALARELADVDRLGSFFDIIGQDPVISRVKLIAEPWDLGEGGYQVGNFPPGWSEWNARYRDSVRRFWKGIGGQAGDLAYRLSGSSDLYADDGRQPHASINFVTAHDGFTLRDLVSYEAKHNEANGESNRDGTDDNESVNFGVEGETDDPAIRAARARQVRNLLATLLLSQGVPMLLGGDELGRTQRGNNNAYCQDNETSWFDWELDDERRALMAFTAELARFAAAHPVLRRRRFLQGRRIRGSTVKDLTWYGPSGEEMTDDEWRAEGVRTLGLRLAGDAISEPDDHGEPIVDDTLLLVLNASEAAVDFRLPADHGSGWQVVLDTTSAGPAADGAPRRVEARETLRIAARSTVLLRHPRQ
ncbi:MAG TPA: glycogen debranching protein GlgX [Candidatus Limnocylindria bacterium]|nr:glycogen debranching protein GlgX [Candidatus Limnocylindria bacterium]